MNRLNSVLLLFLIAFAVGDVTRAKPLLDQAVDIDIDLTAAESQQISHQVLKSAYLPRGYGWPRRHDHGDSAESSEEDEHDDHYFHGHSHQNYGGHNHGGGFQGSFGFGGFPGSFGFGGYPIHGPPPPPPRKFPPKPLPNVKCDCKGPSLTTPKVEGPTPKTEEATTMQTPATTKATTTPASTVLSTTTTTTLPPVTSTAAVTTDEPPLDIDLRFGASNGMT